jgi:hypothetical protein
MALVLSSPADPLAEWIELPLTGQTKCYDSGGNPIACVNTGQDGETLSGAAWPSPRFKDNGDGTISDYLTGLMILKDDDCFAVQKWHEALLTVADFNTNPGTYACKDYTASYKDWYLPNILEIESLANAEEPNSALWLNSQGFWEMKESSYWSSTTNTLSLDEAMIVYMTSVWVRSNHKDSTYAVIPVRAGQKSSPNPSYPANLWNSGQTKCYDETGSEIACGGTGQDADIKSGVPWPSPRFTSNGDGTITDNLNGNIWLEDANCMATKYPNYDTDGTAGDGAVYWAQAFRFVAGINSSQYPDCDAGKDDWRLPNRKDFISLQDASQDSPVLPQGHPFKNVNLDFYWTSTTRVSGPLNAFRLSLEEGILDSKYKATTESYVWPVRGGGPPNYVYLPIVFKN